MKNRIIFLFLSLAIITDTCLGLPMLGAKHYLYILVHGEDGKDESQSFRIFTTNSQGDYKNRDKNEKGLKQWLEQNYGLQGYVFCFQAQDPSGPVKSMAEELGKGEQGFLQKTLAQWKAAHASLPASQMPKKFILIAHSAGGLVAREYLVSGYYAEDVAMIITVNSPHQGNDYPEILEIMENRSAAKRLKKMTVDQLKQTKLFDSFSGLYKYKRVWDSARDVINNLTEFRDQITADLKRIESDYKALSALCQSQTQDANGLLSGIQKNLAALKDLNLPDTAIVSSLLNFRTASLDTAWIRRSPEAEGAKRLFKTLEKYFGPVPDTGLSGILNDSRNLEAIFGLSSLQPRLEAADFNALGLLIAHFGTGISKKPAEQLILLEQKIGGLETLRDHVASEAQFGPAEYQAAALPFSKIASLKSAAIPLKKCLDGFDVRGLEQIGASLYKLEHAEIRLDNALEIYQAVQSVINLESGILKVPSGTDLAGAVQSKIRDIQEFCGAVAGPSAAEILECLKIGTGLIQIQNLNDSAKSLNTIIGGLRLPGQSVQTIQGLDKKRLDSLNNKITVLLGRAEKQDDETIVSWLTNIRAAILLSGATLPPPAPGQAQPILILANKSLPALSQDFIVVLTTAQAASLLSDLGKDLAQTLDRFSGLYQDVTSIQSQISGIVSGLKNSGENKVDSGPDDLFESPDVFSLLLMSLSLLKMLGPAENGASTGSSFAATAQSFLKGMIKDLWKELCQGAVLETATAEAVNRNTSVKPGDPILKDMSGNNAQGWARTNLSTLPAKEQAALQETKYRIVSTRGVLTADLARTRQLSSLTGEEGMLALELKKKINSYVDELTSKIRDRISKALRDKLNDLKIKKPDLRAGALDSIIAGLNPGGDAKKAMALAKDLGIQDAVEQAIQSQVDEVVGKPLSELEGKFKEGLNQTLDDLSGKLEDVAKSKLQESGLLDKINPGMIISMYQSLCSIKDQEGLSVGQQIFSLFYSPILKLSLTRNGDFMVPDKSAAGGDVKLFSRASDVKRYVLNVDDPLEAFTGIMVLAVGLEIARQLIPDPATKETLRVAKLVAVSGLSLIVVFAQRDAMMDYFMNSHDNGVRRLFQGAPPPVQEMLFEKPVATIIMPGQKPEDVFGKGK